MNLQPNLRLFLPGVLLATFLVFTENLTLAQVRPIAQPISLTSFRGCQQVRGPSGQPWSRIGTGSSRELREIPANLRLYRPVAVINSQRLRPNRPVQIVCKIAEPGEPPRFQTLNLSLGMSDHEQSNRGGSVRVSIYSNGNFIDSKTITFGDPNIWISNIRGTEDIALQFECLNPTRGRAWNYKKGDQCPSLFFIDDTIQ